MSREEHDTCKNCVYSQIIKTPYEDIRHCVAYGIEVNDEDSCQNIIIKSDDEEV